MLRLHFNENPYGVVEPVRCQVWEELSQVHPGFYPDAEASRLRKALARHNGTEVERILVGNGSDELLQMMLLAFRPRIEQVIIPTPTFGMYRKSAEVAGLKLREIPLGAEFTLDAEEVAAAAAALPSAVFICWPNNPTANYFDSEAVERVFDSEARLIVVDEAYYEFGGHTYLDRTSLDPRILVVRTLSKAFGMAAMRVGYIIGDPKTLDLVENVRQPYNLSAAAQVAGSVVVENAAAQLATVKWLLDLRGALMSRVQIVEGLEVLASVTNFFLVRVRPDLYGVPAGDLWRLLYERGILVRHFPHMMDYLRISVGSPEQNCRLVEELESIHEEVR